MDDSKKYLKDVLLLMPKEAVLYIYTTDDDFAAKIDALSFEVSGMDFKIDLAQNDLGQILEIIDKEDLPDYIQQCEIKLGDKILFKGYDSMEFGEISNTFVLPEIFRTNYLNNDLCQLAPSW
jgi:hypothetical protein